MMNDSDGSSYTSSSSEARNEEFAGPFDVPRPPTTPRNHVLSMQEMEEELQVWTTYADGSSSSSSDQEDDEEDYHGDEPRMISSSSSSSSRPEGSLSPIAQRVIPPSSASPPKRSILKTNANPNVNDDDDSDNDTDASRRGSGSSGSSTSSSSLEEKDVVGIPTLPLSAKQYQKYRQYMTPTDAATTPATDGDNNDPRTATKKKKTQEWNKFSNTQQRLGAPPALSIESSAPPKPKVPLKSALKQPTPPPPAIKLQSDKFSGADLDLLTSMLAAESSQSEFDDDDDDDDDYTDFSSTTGSHSLTTSGSGSFRDDIARRAKRPPSATSSRSSNKQSTNSGSLSLSSRDYAFVDSTQSEDDDDRHHAQKQEPSTTDSTKNPNQPKPASTEAQRSTHLPQNDDGSKGEESDSSTILSSSEAVHDDSLVDRQPSQTDENDSSREYDEPPSEHSSPQSIRVAIAKQKERSKRSDRATMRSTSGTTTSVPDLESVSSGQLSPSSPSSTHDEVKPESSSSSINLSGYINAHQKQSDTTPRSTGPSISSKTEGEGTLVSSEQPSESETIYSEAVWDRHSRISEHLQQQQQSPVPPPVATQSAPVQVARPSIPEEESMTEIGASFPSSSQQAPQSGRSFASRTSSRSTTTSYSSETSSSIDVSAPRKNSRDGSSDGSIDIADFGESTGNVRRGQAGQGSSSTGPDSHQESIDLIGALPGKGVGSSTQYSGASLSVGKFGASLKERSENDESMGGFSLSGRTGGVEDASQSKFDRPEYDPMCEYFLEDSDMNMNQGFRELDSSTMEFVPPEPDPSDTTEGSPPSLGLRPSEKKSKEAASSGSCCRFVARSIVVLLGMGIIGVPFYLLLFFEAKEPTTAPSQSPMDGIVPTEAPILPAPSVAVVPTSSPVLLLPTASPLDTAPPVASPTLGPLIPQNSNSPTVLTSDSPVESDSPTPPPAFIDPSPAPSTETDGQISALPTVVSAPTSSENDDIVDDVQSTILSAWPQVEAQLDDSTTSQSRALEWLVQSQNVTSFPSKTVLQRFALATLYFSTAGESWLRSSGWLSDQDECLWFSSGAGFPCNESGDYVRLDLSLNGLSGTVPPELALLSNSLRVLEISRGSSEGMLVGSIPSEIGLLSNLEQFNVVGNGLDGSIPPELGNCEKLRSLELTDNKIGGSLMFLQDSMLSNLEDLELDSNSITGQLPAEIEFLTSLRSVNLADNLFTGDIPTEIGQLRVLELLNMNDNLFVNLPTEIGQIILLRFLRVRGNGLAGAIPSELGNLINLRELDLGSNDLSGQIPAELGNIFILRDKLDLSENNLSGTIPSELGQLIFLRDLHLNDNELTGTLPTSFAGLEQMNSLHLERNSLTGTVEANICETFAVTFPVFSMDCETEVECDCCLFCCSDDTGEDDDAPACQCQLENSSFDYLCEVEFE